MNLNWLIVLPVVSALAILPFSQLKQVRSIAAIGATLQLLLSCVLLCIYARSCIRHEWFTGV